ncbi:hypothetical protein [Desulforamulus aeronauticus]|uniref:Uncharacterized protein n=1 Tax=Desulforamulus aeronauticus DSM 10349 TaxID=1121421 RepID=A0A1M6TCT6_9FIRM|nr:hypothetical protein [Desulforamulus aeronauticus]SHK54852.1 hypothetical protein SAMN02745123_02269 [Desulforamulus aeronauticus DSM 10349]
MNKIKLMYNVAKTMKEKTLFQGSFQATCVKDQATVLQMDNKFSKNLSSGLTKATIKTEMDYEGKSFKHESSTEFTHTEDCHRRGHFLKGRHPHFHHRDCGHFGLKGFFSKITVALDLLNRIKVEEQPDNTTLMTLEIDELPAELQALKTQLMEKHHHEQEQPTHHHRHCLAKELHGLENPRLTLVATINKNNELSNAALTLSGQQAGTAGENHTLTVNAKLTLQ